MTAPAKQATAATAKAADAKTAPAPSAKAPAATGEEMYAYLARDGGTFKAPLFADESENLAVATVDEETVTLRELTRAIAGSHGGRAETTHAGKKDFAPILDRLIEARLLAREAREMGIAELPEYKTSVEAFRQTAGRELLQAEVVKDIKADPAEVEKLFRQRVREWKVRSVLVAKQEDAKQIQPQVKAGKKFEDVAKQLVAEKKAKGGEESAFIGRAQALPEVLAALEKMKVGEVSAPVKLKDGFAVLKVEDMRYPEDAKIRAEVSQASIARQNKAALKKYYDALVKRYARTDEALLKSVDFEAKKPGIEALKKDKRVIARIEGGKPVTVGDLAEAVAQGFFHGVKTAVEEKRVNRDKMSVFDALLSERIVPLEVKRAGIDATAEYKARVADFENSLLFSKFLEKAVLPELKVSDDQLKKYYAEHKKEFTYPTFYKVESLAFTSLKGAEAAVKQLRGGTDYRWLNANAEGQVKASDRKLGLDGTLAATGLPKDLANLLSGVKKGDYRLYGDDAAQQYYAIHVMDVVGATEQPFEAAKEGINQKLFEDALTSAIKTWAGKLRKASQVKVFLTRIGS